MTDTNTRRTMIARRHGWEGASPALLARVFNVSVQRATAICRERCAACGRPICGHTDAEWTGAAPAMPAEFARAYAEAGYMPASEYVRHRIQHHSRPSFSTADRDGGCGARAASCVNAATVAGRSFEAAKPGNVAPIPQDSLWQPEGA